MPAAMPHTPLPPDAVVVSGLGLLSALGLDAAEHAAALGEGESALAPPTRAGDAVPPNTLAGEVPPFDLARLLSTTKGYLDRNSELLLAAAAQARAAAALTPGSASGTRAGLAFGTAWGGLDTLSAFFADYTQKGPRLVKPMLFPHSYANTAVSLAAMEWELRGPHLNHASGRLASTHALLAARDALAANEADCMLAGGGEALGPTLWRTLAASGRLATTDHPPHPLDDDGGPPAPGEGAAVLALERAATAAARGATPLAVLAGGGLAGPSPRPSDSARTAVSHALADAALAPSDIAFACVSACGHPTVDAAERAALAAVCGPDLPLVAPAALLGDTQGACGAIQAACAVLILSGPFTPPTQSPAFSHFPLPGSRFPPPASALVLTTNPDGSSAALVLSSPRPHSAHG